MLLICAGSTATLQARRSLWWLSACDVFHHKQWVHGQHSLCRVDARSDCQHVSAATAIVHIDVGSGVSFTSDSTAFCLPVQWHFEGLPSIMRQWLAWVNMQTHLAACDEAELLSCAKTLVPLLHGQPTALEKSGTINKGGAFRGGDFYYIALMHTETSSEEEKLLFWPVTQQGDQCMRNLSPCSSALHDYHLVCLVWMAWRAVHRRAWAHTAWCEWTKGLSTEEHRSTLPGVNGPKGCPQQSMGPQGLRSGGYCSWQFNQHYAPSARSAHPGSHDQAAKPSMDTRLLSPDAGQDSKGWIYYRLMSRFWSHSTWWQKCGKKLIARAIHDHTEDFTLTVWQHPMAFLCQECHMRMRDGEQSERGLPYVMGRYGDMTGNVSIDLNTCKVQYCVATVVISCLLSPCAQWPWHQTLFGAVYMRQQINAGNAGNEVTGRPCMKSWELGFLCGKGCFLCVAQGHLSTNSQKPRSHYALSSEFPSNLKVAIKTSCSQHLFPTFLQFVPQFLQMSWEYLNREGLSEVTWGSSKKKKMPWLLSSATMCLAKGGGSCKDWPLHHF